MRLRIVRLHEFIPCATGTLLPIISSDTLFGAICNAIAEIFGPDTLTSILKNMEGNPTQGFSISSAFPFRGNIYAIPLLGKEFLINPDDKEGIDHKELKKCFVNIDFFSTSEFLTQKYLVNPDTLPTMEQRPRNRLSRISDKATSFFSTTVMRPQRAKEEAGFWVAYGGRETGRVEAALKYLKDEGIGGDRGVGLGRFSDIKWDSITVPDSGNHFVNLSLYVPSSEELTAIQRARSTNNSHTLLAYKLVRRQGWVEVYGKGEKLKPARMYFVEGSIFSATTNKMCYGVCGRYKNLNVENHQVWWSGITLPLYFTLRL